MRRSLISALFVTAFLLAGCGASGGSETSSGTDASKATTSTTATTTAAPKAPKAVTAAQLQAILPKPADIGTDYRVKKSSGSTASTTTTAVGQEPSASDKAFEEACPKAKKLDLMNDDPNDDEVNIEFDTEDDRGFEVSLDPTPKGFSKDTMDQVIDAYNECGEVSFTDPDTGKMTMQLSAKPLEGVGDYGADVTLSADFDLFGQPTTIAFHGYLFVVNGVGVTVTASDGINPATMANVPGDTKLIAPVSTEMEQRVRSITE